MENLTWIEVTEDKYTEMLEILPPAAMGANGFLVGEPMNHTAQGDPTFEAFRRENGKHYVASRSMTIAEFRKHVRNVQALHYSD